MPSSTAVTEMVPDWMTRPSLEAMPSLPLPVTVSAPAPVIVRSAALYRAAFAVASSAACTSIAAPAVVSMSTPSSTRRTWPSAVESTMTCPEYEPERMYVPGSEMTTVAPETAAPSPLIVADDPDRAIVVASDASYSASSLLSCGS